VQGDGVQACVCGCGTGSAGAELRAAACSAWRCPRWASSGRDWVGVQGGRARCGRSCSAAAAGGSAREQWGRAWWTSEAVEEKAADEGRRHCELLVENGGGLARTAAEGAALMQADHGPRGGKGSGYGAASSEGEAMQRHEAVGVEAARRGSDAWCRTVGWPGSIPQTRARARRQATREQVEGQGCRSKVGAAALRVAAQACRQCTHRSIQVEEGFFLCSGSSCASRNVLSAMR
jgi:hypothetical protein